MLRPLLVGALTLVLAACQAAQTSPAPSSTMTPVTSMAATESPTPSSDLSPSPVASQGVANGPFAWAPLIGLDLRGAFVATGAASVTRTVLLGADTKTSALVAWTSDDGTHWERHWLEGTTFGGGLPWHVVAGGPGFVASGWELGTDLSLRPAIWTSSDGTGWSLDPDPSSHFDGEPYAMAATPSSVVIAAGRADAAGSAIWSSTDGLAWRDSTPSGASGAMFQLAAAGGSYLVVASVDRGQGDGSTALKAWRSVDGRSWRPDESLGRHLTELTGVNDVFGAGDRFILADDSDAYQVVGDDGTLSAIDRPTEYGEPVDGGPDLAWVGQADEGPCLSAWVRGASTWDLAEPSTSGCAQIPEVERQIAMPDGWLIVGSGASPNEDTVWAVRPAGSVAMAETPGGAPPIPPASAIPTPPTGAFPVPADCPDGEVTIKALVRLSGRDRVACFGPRSLTMRAWVVDPGEGYGGTCAPMTPRWLQVCVLPDWLLSEERTRNAGPEEDRHIIDPPKFLDALKSPGAKGDLKGVGRWVNVTGHFDDPAAATCRPASGPAGIGLEPMASFVLQCREQFVVTRMETTR
jgi:hypothetical protein